MAFFPTSTLGRALQVCSFLSVSFGAWSAEAAPVIETVDRLEINWSTLRFRFYGEARFPDDASADAFKELERRAWQDGLNYVQRIVRDLHVALHEPRQSNVQRLSEDAKNVAKQITTSTFSYNTTYYADGLVRVHLENLLPKAYQSSAIRFRQKEASESRMMEHTGVVLTLNKTTSPAALYRIVDEQGNLLFDVSEMAQEAYAKNLMGRWFKRPNQAELSEAVGQAPLKLTATVTSDGVFSVNRAAWEQAIAGHRSLFVNGQVAIALP